MSVWIQPVQFDPDILCERCGRQSATHYAVGSMPAQFIRDTRSGCVELCEPCVEKLKAELAQQPTWALMQE